MCSFALFIINLAFSANYIIRWQLAQSITFNSLLYTSVVTMIIIVCMDLKFIKVHFATRSDLVV